MKSFVLKYNGTKGGKRMDFNESIGKYTCEADDLIFAWDEEPTEDMSETIEKLSKNYYSHLDEIVQFMMPDLKMCYGDVDPNAIKEKLGKPIIDYDNGTVTYLEQSFDNEHIFEFEFLDDAFEELQYFSIDG